MISTLRKQIFAKGDVLLPFWFCGGDVWPIYVHGGTLRAVNGVKDLPGGKMDGPGTGPG